MVSLQPFTRPASTADKTGSLPHPSSRSRRLKRRGLDPSAMDPPFRPAPVGDVGVVRAVARHPVDQFAHDVGVTGVPGRLDAHVDEDLLQGHPPTLARPPRNLARRVERKRLDRRVAVRGRPLMELDDRGPSLVRRRPQVRVRFSVVSRPREDQRARPAEHLAKVPNLDACRVLDQAEQVRACRRHRTPSVVLAQAIELGKQVRASKAQIAEQDRFVVHPVTMPGKRAP